MTQIFWTSSNGDVFTVRHTKRGYSVLTNQYGCQTRVVWTYAKKILGLN